MRPSNNAELIPQDIVSQLAKTHIGIIASVNQITLIEIPSIPMFREPFSQEMGNSR
jgi:hypothetical protein